LDSLRHNSGVGEKSSRDVLKIAEDTYAGCTAHTQSV